MSTSAFVFITIFSNKVTAQKVGILIDLVVKIIGDILLSFTIRLIQDDLYYIVSYYIVSYRIVNGLYLLEIE